MMQNRKTILVFIENSSINKRSSYCSLQGKWWWRFCWQKPELYAVENWDDIIFDEFSRYEKLVTKFKESLSSFDDSKTENSFFEAIICGVLFKLSDGKSVTKNKAENVLGRDLYSAFCEVKDKLKVDTSMYG